MPERDTPDGQDAAEPGRDDGPVLRSTRLPAASASTPRSGVADREARAAELREALDALRATLEGRPMAPSPPPTPSRPSPPSPPPSSPRTPRTIERPALVAVAAIAAVVLVAGGTLAVLRSRTSGPEPSADPRPSTSSTRPASASASPATPSTSASRSASAGATPAPVPTTRPLPWPGGAVLAPPGLPVAGPGATAPGVELTAALDPDGRHLDVYERIVLRPGVTSFLAEPADLRSLAPALGAVRPVVDDLQVEVDGQPVRPVPAQAGWRIATPSGRSLRAAVLRYRVSGAVVRQSPAPPGRVTLVLRPLGAAAARGRQDPVVVRVVDPRLRALSCPTSRRPLCGGGQGTTWTATVPDDATAVVLAQVDRPQP